MAQHTERIDTDTLRYVWVVWMCWKLYRQEVPKH